MKYSYSLLREINKQSNSLAIIISRILHYEFKSIVFCVVNRDENHYIFFYTDESCSLIVLNWFVSFLFKARDEHLHRLFSYCH